MALDFKNLAKKVYRFLWKAALVFFIASVVSVILFRWIPVPVTPLMIKRCVQQGISGKELRLYKDWVPLEDISHHLQLAVVVCEDQYYLNHYGVDIDALKKAFKSNKKGRRLRGGSTISQQTAKNVFLWDGRNYIRKGLELYFTLLIETFWDKERILEVYLNIIELGNGVYGAEAAAQHYYHKSAKKLTKREAASIAVILPSPLKYKPVNGGPFVQNRINWTLNQMRMWGGKLDFEEYNTPGLE
jgi:monofunctional glycosyltransferase